MKGVILAGGSGTRLNPLTTVVGKQLLPVYDKPMIYYPLSTLILAGSSDILIITTPNEIERFQRLLGNGSQFGIDISYQIQVEPKGLAQGVQLAKTFANEESFWFILGDNLFHGPDFGLHLSDLPRVETGAHIFAYRVSDPSQYGVIQFSDTEDEIQRIIEKPEYFVSNWAVPGLYYFDETAFERTETLTPSHRGELEIIDLIETYRTSGQLTAHKVSRGNAWFDLGTPESLLVGGQFVQLIQSRQGLLVGSPEEAAFRKGFLTKETYLTAQEKIPQNHYSKMIINLMDED